MTQNLLSLHTLPTPRSISSYQYQSFYGEMIRLRITAGDDWSKDITIEMTADQAKLIQAELRDILSSEAAQLHAY